jgi:hypothetical protein
MGGEAVHLEGLNLHDVIHLAGLQRWLKLNAVPVVPSRKMLTRVRDTYSNVLEQALEECHDKRRLR